MTGRAARCGGARFLRPVPSRRVASRLVSSRRQRRPGPGSGSGSPVAAAMMAYFVESFWVGKRRGPAPPRRGWNGQGTARCRRGPLLRAQPRLLRHPWGWARALARGGAVVGGRRRPLRPPQLASAGPGRGGGGGGERGDGPRRRLAADGQPAAGRGDGGEPPPAARPSTSRGARGSVRRGETAGGEGRPAAAGALGRGRRGHGRESLRWGGGGGLALAGTAVRGGGLGCGPISLRQASPTMQSLGATAPALTA